MRKDKRNDTNTNMNQILELSDMDDRADIIKMFRQANVSSFETKENVDNLSKETDVKKMENRKLKEI